MPRPQLTKLPLQCIDELRDLYREQGEFFNWERTAKEWGITVPTLRAAIKGASMDWGLKFDDFVVMNVRREYSAGKTYKEIYDKWGVNQKDVVDICFSPIYSHVDAKVPRCVRKRDNKKSKIDKSDVSSPKLKFSDETAIAIRKEYKAGSWYEWMYRMFNMTRRDIHVVCFSDKYAHIDAVEPRCTHRISRGKKG